MLVLIYVVAGMAIAASPLGDLKGKSSGIEEITLQDWCAGMERSSCLEGGFRDQPEVLAIEDGDSGEHIWFEGSDYAAYLEEKEIAYRAKVLEEYGVEEMSQEERTRDLQAIDDDTQDQSSESAVLQPMQCQLANGSFSDDDTVSDGNGGCKLIFGTDSRTQVSNPLSYPWSKQVVFMMRQATSQPNGGTSCSGTFVDEEYVLTAAHCVYDTADNDWIYANPANPDLDPNDNNTPYGLDNGRGYVCLGGSVNSAADFQAHCEFVQTRYILPGYVDAPNEDDWDAVEHDVALLKIYTTNHPNGLGDNAWMAMSTITSATTLEQKTAVSYGYPGTRPAGASNTILGSFLVSGVTWNIVGRDQYKTSGSVDAPTTGQRIMTKLESGGGQSGSAILYYSDNSTSYTGQAHYIIGVLFGTAADFNGNTANDYTTGATVMQFKSWVETFID